MIKQIKHAIAKIFVGNNYFLRSLIRRELAKGCYIKAALLTLYTLPIRKLISLENVFFSTSMDYYEKLHKLLHISKVDGFDLVRIGRDNDGGYIMLDNFKLGGVAYSFGISDDVSFDKDIASKGYDVFMYDHTIEKLPENNSKFHFFRQGIAEGKTQDERLKSLEYFISQNKHENNRDMILKMDVEGAEWGFFESVKSETLSQFSQIIMEFHGIMNPLNPEKLLNVLNKINLTHQIVHIHANNIGNSIFTGGKFFSDVLEVSYVNRNKYKFVSNYDVNLLLNLDMPNRKTLPEINFYSWNNTITYDEYDSKLVSILMR